MRFALLFLFPYALAGQTLWSLPISGNGGILQPSGDRTLSNVLVGSAVTPDGVVGYTRDVYWVKADGASPVRLTKLDETDSAPGASAVAISPDGKYGAYLAILNSAGARSEEVHVIDFAAMTDHRIAVGSGNCVQPKNLAIGYFVPCLERLSFSQDSRKVIWAESDRGIVAANQDGSTVQVLMEGGLSLTPSVTTSDGRLIFTGCAPFAACTIGLDGSGLKMIASGSGPISISDANISADGSAVAYQFLRAPASGGGGPFYSLGALDSDYYFPFWGVSFSNDGSVQAWIHPDTSNAGSVRVAGLGTGPLNDASFHSVFDVQVSGDGSSLLYSPGFGTLRGAVWICDKTGRNAHPIFAPRSISLHGITGINTSAANQSLSPGSYFIIYGTNFQRSFATVTASSAVLPLTLADIQVSVNGMPVPIQAVTPWQINALLPQNASSGTASVKIKFADGAFLFGTAPVAQTAPALITFFDSYSPRIAFFHGGTSAPVDYMNPAQAGEVLSSYGFGLGVTNPRVTAGEPAPVSPLARTLADAQLVVEGQAATVLYSGLVPELAGLYQINFVVPGGMSPGRHAAVWRTADSTSPPGDLYVQ